MKSHAQSLVDGFRARTPYREHDRFINYFLVYAYSTEDGTDQCDCSIVRDTAMSTRFLNSNPICGHSDNRCLYYGGGCDTDTSMHIATTELRAPADDKTIVMVNTTRYGGCAGSRAVYAGAAGSAVEIAIHELGHSLAGLDDEYGGIPSCGAGSGFNTSTDAVSGNWPEWIADLGAPWQGAKYYEACVYRPVDLCEMRALGYEFCPVCRQQWALTFFGHPRVSPTAPLESQSPGSPVSTNVGNPVTFSIGTRLAGGSGVANQFTWQLQGPGFPAATTVATGTDNYTRSFSLPGTYTITSQVVADTNFIKPSKNGANVDTASWTVSVCDPGAQADEDNDGLVDSCDPCPGDALNDEDNDGVCFGIGFNAPKVGDRDNCLTVANQNQTDSDGDTRGDACDNCAFDFDPSQTDFDHDDQGDVCDLDDGQILIVSTNRNYREWQAETGYTTWNSYRGSLAVLRATGEYTQAPGSNPLAARDCGLTDPWVFDLVVPAPDEVAFTVVTGVAGGVESGLGANSAGTPRLNANPCP
jgi:hypothetical protein